jgi:hypothetical protein
MNCRCFKKIEFYYTYDSLKKNLINDTKNLRTYLYQGTVYKDKEQIIPFGDIFIEQTVDENTGQTKSIVNVITKQGVISYVLFHKTDDGKGIQGEITGPVIYGTEKYLTWNSSNYYSKIINYENNRHVIIYKN